MITHHWHLLVISAVILQRKCVHICSHEMMTSSDRAVLHGEIEFLHEALLVEHVPHLQHYKEL